MQTNGSDQSLREAATTVRQLEASPRSRPWSTTRVLQIVIDGSVRSLNSPGVPASELLGAALARDRSEVENALADTIRAQVAAYFPDHYTIFVRVDMLASGDQARVTYWIATPQLRWSSGLLARRTWTLLLPILQRVAVAGFSERLPDFTLVANSERGFVSAYAPRRLLTEPIVLAAVIGVLCVMLLKWPPAFATRLLNVGTLLPNPFV